MKTATAKPPARRRARVKYVTVAGKKIKSTPRMRRILRAVQVLKGLSPD